MDTSSQTPDYGEPWKAMSAGAVHNRNDNLVAGYSARHRMISCVNACVGMADPAAEIQAMRDAIKEAHHFIRDIVKNYECGDDVDANGESALAKLKPFVTQ